MGMWEFWLWMCLGAMGIAGAVAIVALICDAWARRKPAKPAKASKGKGPSYGLRPPRPRPEPPPLPRPEPPQFHEWETKSTTLFFGDGAGGKNHLKLSGSHVKFTKNDEVVYEGPLDDAPDDVIRAVRSFRQGIGKFDFDAFDGISESFRDDMDKFRKDMDDLGKETDK